MLYLGATIEPGKAAAGISIGDPVATLLLLGHPTRSKIGGGVEVFDFGDVRVWAKGGVVDQIGVRGEYTGRITMTKICLGSTIQQVADAMGPVVEDEVDNLIVAHVPGICFETTRWRGSSGGETVQNNLDAKLVEIFVFSRQAS